MTTVKPSEMQRWTFLPTGRLAPYWWLAMFIVLQVVDFATGPFYQLPSTYALAVFVAAWFSGLRVGIALAFALPLGRVAFMYEVWNEPWDANAFLATAVTRLAVFTIVAVAADRLANHERAMSHEVEQLVALLPVCADCRRIRDQEGEWTSLDAFVAARKGDFQPGLCTECARIRLPEHVAPAGRP